ncbi:hypothetical protein CWC24_14900 [Pseudoalteromonas ruthenica]|nr:hypothetical protein CWC24_14900 [Pseudoalteromonas ruthenica]TMO52956.1 hypothetical protein CWC23_00480 [Pseudoalteromonas ruthenica]
MEKPSAMLGFFVANSYYSTFTTLYLLLIDIHQIYSDYFLTGQWQQFSSIFKAFIIVFVSKFYK